MRKATEIRGHRQPQAAELVHRIHPGKSKASTRRADPRYAPLLVSAIMTFVISLAVSLVETIVRLGFTSSLVPAGPDRRMPRALNRKPPSANNGYSIPFPRKEYLL